MSVSDLASRYQPIDEPMTPRRGSVSPTTVNQDSPTGQASRDASVGEDEIRKRRQTTQDLAELEFKEKEYELRQRERELNQKTRDFERNRIQFLDARDDPFRTSEGDT